MFTKPMHFWRRSQVRDIFCGREEFTLSIGQIVGGLVGWVGMLGGRSGISLVYSSMAMLGGSGESSFTGGGMGSVERSLVGLAM